LTLHRISLYFRLVRTRGSGRNPSNRFEPIRSVPTPEEAADLEERHPETRLLADPSRTIVATNASPDVGFEASVNPYRGCEHGCSYCLAPETPILCADLVWRPIGNLRPGDALVGFDENPAPGRTRRLRPAVVLAVWWSQRPTRRLVTSRAEVVTTPEHRFLQARDFRWSRTEQLRAGSLLRRLPVVPTEPVDDDYRAGYLAGLTIGDGTFRYEPGWRSDKLGFPAAYWRVALIDHEPLLRAQEFLASFGLEVQMRPFSPGARTSRPMWKLETRSLPKLEVIRKLVDVERASRAYRRGFVAGFFDAEGHDGNSLRMSQVDTSVLDRVRRYARSLGFRFALEPHDGRASAIRLVGGVADRIAFFSTVRPAIARKRQAFFGRTPDTAPEPVERIEAGPVRDVVDIQTSTGTFYAAGLATHNCYARPTHEYLGFSAGLDFETRILVKERAPELLRARLSAPSWRPQVVALSGVTDAYQPAERRLGITRRCLEVLAEFRNPVAVVTKSFLVTRDADLLAELARLGAASVCLSITTLDPELQRRMEPRAAPPGRRLAAIEALAATGVPVGVLVAPIVPGLTDHEVPRILAAAARAGASFAGRVVLRLPHGVKELFDAWLAEHYPERRTRVLSRVRQLRGGRLYDSRFGARQRGEGFFADQMDALFDLARRRAGLAERGPELSTASFRRPGGGGGQLALL
jgi:DNA repair photolyase